MRKLIFVALVIALLIGFFGSAMAQEGYVGDSVGQNIEIPMQEVPFDQCSLEIP